MSLSNGVPVLDRSRPAIYWQSDTVQLKGKAHARFSYVWCYSPGPQGSERGQSTNNVSPGRPESGLPLQGIRITLNSAGQPVIWEVLADSSGAELIFVSQNLEAAAVAEFGKPLPGRRYAIERSVDEAPNVIVARVIDDGPVAMGPIVYLSAGTRAVSTLICRCMPAQAKRLLAHERLRFVALPGNGGAIAPDAGKSAGKGANCILARGRAERQPVGEMPAVAVRILRKGQWTRPAKARPGLQELSPKRTLNTA